ncbi:hypothetical protein [Bradyrhizobium erythrophlei]|jgi:hypothetical protein|uniref:Uncharacterized protein n=1 Tax=Bradyrhizobium erythrophlei TaxID=1437360 RepID=A0A1M7UEJ9_9BRAD|nr:hypothetical protein [Bradyrhizobium erythrophlei]SHN81335.1 hypothetical protein SAMN05444170_4691 [Bradyrhizobium erythrophlei]
MQRELPTINFTSEAEVRSKAESRRTEEVANLLKDFFAGWTPRLRRTLRLRRILEAVRETQRPAAAGRS